MPVSIRNVQATIDTTKHPLKVPQARVLAALMPEDVTWPVSEWPLITRTYLNAACGYSQISTGVTRPMQGIPPGSSSGKSYPGLIQLGYVEEVVLDVEGVTEVNYRATQHGAAAYLEWSIQQGGNMPKHKDAKSCINKRFKDAAK